MMCIFRFLSSWVGTLLVAFVFGTVAFYGEELGRLEGRFFPVATDISLAYVPTDDARSVLANGSFIKSRPCDYIDIDARLADGRATTRIRLDFLDGSQLRQEGRQNFGPWLIQASVIQFERMAYIDVQHDRHPFWPTITRFYP